MEVNEKMIKLKTLKHLDYFAPLPCYCDHFRINHKKKTQIVAPGYTKCQKLSIMKINRTSSYNTHKNSRNSVQNSKLVNWLKLKDMNHC